MTDREALIEKAAKALYMSQWHDGNYERTAEFNKDAWRAHARAALAIFEEAWSSIHTVNVMREDWDRLKRIEQAHAKPLDVPTEPVKNGGDSLHDAEPTDAQVNAAHEAFWASDDVTGGHDAIRAALRAAFKAGGEGR